MPLGGQQLLKLYATYSPHMGHTLKPLLKEFVSEARTCSVKNCVYIWERLSSASSWLNLAWSSAACCGCIINNSSRRALGTRRQFELLRVASAAGAHG